MAAIPRETIMTTLLLLGIGVVLVIALLIFTFSILSGPAGFGPESKGTPTIPPNFNYQTPTPEYVPNNPDNQPTIYSTPIPTQPTDNPINQFPESLF